MDMNNYDFEMIDEIDSTNDEAKRRLAAKDYDKPFVIVARHQTAGRGRHGKSFYSPKDTGIYLTVTRPFDCGISDQVSITTRTAVAVAQAIEEEFGIEPQIKWVNDIYLGNRKCCGILCEAVNDYEKDRLKYVVMGVGVNVTTSSFPDDIAETAGAIMSTPTNMYSCTDNTSFNADTGSRLPVSTNTYISFAHRISEKILDITSDLSDLSYLDYYRSHSLVIGRDITFIENGITIPATALDITDTGALLVRLKTPLQGASSERLLDSGEITVRLCYTR